MVLTEQPPPEINSDGRFQLIKPIDFIRISSLLPIYKKKASEMTRYSCTYVLHSNFWNSWVDFSLNLSALSYCSTSKWHTWDDTSAADDDDPQKIRFIIHGHWNHHYGPKVCETVYKHISEAEFKLRAGNPCLTSPKNCCVPSDVETF